jgi:hypothetical protein
MGTIVVWTSPRKMLLPPGRFGPVSANTQKGAQLQHFSTFSRKYNAPEIKKIKKI